jgi:hypothetical protein
MAWTIKPMGSWGAATSSAPGSDFPAALALPGTWHWYPGPTTLAVRKDQWGSLAAAPGVDRINPMSGLAAGGTTVQLLGEGLTGSTGVTFGGTAATGFVVNSDAAVTCVTPAHAAGGVTVVLLNPRGNVTMANAYTFI